MPISLTSPEKDTRSALLSNLKAKTLYKEAAFINGQWIPSSSSAEVFKSQDPFNQSAVATLPDLNVAHVREAAKAADVAFKSWSKTPATTRSNFLREWRRLIDENIDDLALLITAENGKPVVEAKNELLSSCSIIENFSEEAKRIDGDYCPFRIPNQRVMTLRQPVGVCGLLSPWNFPVLLVVTKLGASLAAGCTSILKPSPETSLVALALVELLVQAKVPPGVVNVITTKVHLEAVGEEMVKNELIKLLFLICLYFLFYFILFYYSLDRCS